uniref:Uncharacterized protein n=1 Tax=Arundo donax TaxID=35708 RepID=A0A0A9B9M8_ARUDO
MLNCAIINLIASLNSVF